MRALNLIASLRASGMFPSQIRVGDVRIELTPTIAPPGKSKGGPVRVNDVISEYGSPAIEKMLSEGDDDDLVPAVKA